MRTPLTIVFWILIVSQVSGQSEWTLENCIRYAIEHNIKVRLSEYSYERTEQYLRQAKWNISPSIGASSGLGYNIGRTFDDKEGRIVTDPYYGNSYNLNTSMNVFSGFSTMNRISYWKYMKESANSAHHSEVDNLAFEVMNSFYDVIYYKELLKIVNEQKELSELNVTKTELFVNTGLKSPADLLEIKANLESDKLTCIQTENMLDAAWINLKKALNISMDGTILLVMPANKIIGIESENTGIRSLYESCLAWKPNIKSYQYLVDANNKNISISKSGFFPSLSASANYATGFATNYDTSFSYQIRRNQKQYVGMSLSIPIFRRRSTITDVKLAKLDFESAKADLEQAKQDLWYEMLTNYNDLKAAKSEYAQALKQLEADTLAYRAAEKKYDQGMIDVVELFTAKNRLAETQGQVLRSGLTVEIKRRIIDFYRGNRFWEK